MHTNFKWKHVHLSVLEVYKNKAPKCVRSQQKDNLMINLRISICLKSKIDK